MSSRHCQRRTCTKCNYDQLLVSSAFTWYNLMFFLTILTIKWKSNQWKSKPSSTENCESMEKSQPCIFNLVNLLFSFLLIHYLLNQIHLQSIKKNWFLKKNYDNNNKNKEMNFSGLHDFVKLLWLMLLNFHLKS